MIENYIEIDVSKFIDFLINKKVSISLVSISGRSAVMVNTLEGDCFTKISMTNNFLLYQFDIYIEKINKYYDNILDRDEIITACRV